MTSFTIEEFFEAIETGDKAVVEQTLRNDTNLCNAENEQGLTALGVASHFDQKEIVELLLNFGADINSVSNSKVPYIPSNTALHAGIAGKASKELVEFLLNQGANVNQSDSSGHTPLHIAAFDGSSEIVSLLLAFGNGRVIQSEDIQSPLEIATERNNKDFLRAHEKFEKTKI
ncbi:ankyrin repeat domain-containing protein [Rossellomorea sp. SC111]|uniref:ankyrin repeat domain-containing protein n=1 Tax=Rossellomorea sp. SC111 TaxID=2968985 RepID=UPI00215A2270|nr:ankyrin repeat domain-containing protein [Rossellomorea sp. SC111]MCR8848754.1 ankyrin repeat domain-containing protein [Rossellomorea sp. SC111]